MVKLRGYKKIKQYIFWLSTFYKYDGHLIKAIQTLQKGILTHR